MLNKASLVESCTVQASDGELGKVKDIYFDSQKWIVRYLVMDTRKWLPGKKVLLSPILFKHMDIFDHTISVDATKEQVKNSPSIDEHQPVSRKIESELHSYYGWAPYWYGVGVWGSGMYPGHLNPAAKKYARQDNLQQEVLEDDDANGHLRSMNELKGMVGGYEIIAKDKELGTVVDFIIDDQTWAIQYVVVDTGDFLPGEKVLLTPESITEIDAIAKKVFTDVYSDQVKRRSEETMNQESIMDMEASDIEEIWKRKII